MSFLGTPCRHCGSNNLGVMSDYARSFSQIVCSHCDARGPRIERGYSKERLTEKENDKKAYAGWDKIHGECK